MKYFATNKRSGVEREITYEEAMDYLKANYVERECTFDEMLSHEGTIPCMFSIIEVRTE